MPSNIYKTPGYKRLVAVTDPAAPASGDPVRYGSLTGLCLVPENAAFQSVNDFGPGEWIIPVKGEAGAILVGDALFYDDGISAVNNDSANGYFFGFALGAVGNGLTATIHVFHVPSPGAGTLGAGTVGAANLASNAVTTVKIAAANVTEAKIATASLTGLVAAVVANANVIGGLLVMHRIDIAAGALGNTDVVLTHKTRVIDAFLVLRGAGVATTTLQVFNGAGAITNAMAASGADTALVRAANIDEANHEIAAGGTLRVTSATGATQPDAVVYVLGVRVA